MKHVPMIYREKGKLYKPDTCQPLKQAADDGKVELCAWGRGSYPGYTLPENELPGLNLVGYWDAPCDQDWGLEWHRNEGLEFTFLESGHDALCIETDVLDLRPNDLVLTRPWQPHRIGNPTVGTGRVHWMVIDVNVRQPHQKWVWPEWIVLNRSDLAELTKFLRQNEQPLWPCNEHIRNCFKQFGRIVADENPKKHFSRMAVFVNELLLNLLDMFRTQSVPLERNLTSSQRSVELFLHHIRAHLAQPWTLETMAEACELGVTRFMQIVKTHTNKTPIQYLARMRAEEAAALLRAHPDETITNIALQCGFSSSQYFSTVFRKYFKMTPRKYREQAEAKS